MIYIFILVRMTDKRDYYFCNIRYRNTETEHR